jgi:(p)ppGpp synthase/HD superfamily hydrolase
MEHDPAEGTEATDPPPWVAESPPLARAHRLAAQAHAAQHRPSDGAPFLEHVVEVAVSLHDAGFDEDLVAAGLLHDAVERGTLTEERLRSAMGNSIASLVLALTEDGDIESFARRKEALRGKVRAGGDRAVTIFAADKLSDIRGLRRGIDRFGDSVEARIGTSIDDMADHYRASVEMIETSDPELEFVPALRAELRTVAALEHSS